MCDTCAGVTHANELSSKHAKARAPNTHHDSSAEWQRQSSSAKGEVEEWEGDLLILGVGNAQQAGLQPAVVTLPALLVKTAQRLS